MIELSHETSTYFDRGVYILPPASAIHSDAKCYDAMVPKRRSYGLLAN